MEEALTALLLADTSLDALVGDRIYWDTVPQGKASPVVVMYLISDAPDYHAVGPSGLVDSLVQIDCRGTTKASALAVARAVQNVLSGYSGTQGAVRFHPILKVAGRSSFERTDAGEKFYVASADYEVWSGAAA